MLSVSVSVSPDTYNKYILYLHIVTMVESKSNLLYPWLNLRFSLNLTICEL